MVGELDAGKPHVQFDEWAQETCDSATRLCPTLPKPLASYSGAKMTFRMSARSGGGFGANYHLGSFPLPPLPLTHFRPYPRLFVGLSDVEAGARASTRRLLAMTPNPTQRSIPGRP